MKAIQMYRRGGVFLTAFLLVSLLFSLSSCSGGTNYVGTSGGTSGGTSYTVTFKTNGGSAVDSQTVAAGETAKEPEDPKKDGYKFGGWYADSELTSLFSFAAKIEKDTTLYAKWTETADKMVAVTSVALDKETATVNVLGTVKTVTLVATVLPENATDKTVTWTSSDTSKATVDANGVVTGVSGGVVTITATAGGKSAACKVGIDFVKVAGTTISGSETWTPQSEVFVAGRSLTIGDLWVCDHEVTQAEYEAYCKYGSDSPSDTYGKGENYSVYFVSRYDAMVYCNLHSMAENLTPVYAIGGEKDPSKWTDIVSGTTDGVTKYCGPNSTNATWNGMTFDSTANGYRLLTEAEWEYIAREAGASDTTYSGSNTIGDVAWYGSHSGKTHEVKGKAANALGIYDMSGNVWEWCWDLYEATITASTPAAGPSSDMCVKRGGSWWDDASFCAVSYRGSHHLDHRGNNHGFRVVRAFN